MFKKALKQKIEFQFGNSSVDYIYDQLKRVPKNNVCKTTLKLPKKRQKKKKRYPQKCKGANTKQLWLNC